jgi:hypothetical protein
LIAAAGCEVHPAAFLLYCSRKKDVMKITGSILAVIISTAWISVSEFVRNQVLFKSYWTGHYDKMGLVFPAEPLNGAVWGIWSLFLALSVFFILKKFPLTETVVLAWFMAFPMMWLVIGNLNVLPHGLLIFAIPLSLVEVIVAALIIKQFMKNENKRSTGQG